MLHRRRKYVRNRAWSACKDNAMPTLYLALVSGCARLLLAVAVGVMGVEEPVMMLLEDKSTHFFCSYANDLRGLRSGRLLRLCSNAVHIRRRGRFGRVSPWLQDITCEKDVFKRVPLKIVTSSSIAQVLSPLSFYHSQTQ